MPALRPRGAPGPVGRRPVRTLRFPTNTLYLHCAPMVSTPHLAPDSTDAGPLQHPPMQNGQYLGRDLEISVVVEQCHIMVVGNGGD